MGHEEHTSGAGSLATIVVFMTSLFIILGVTNPGLQGVSASFEQSMAAKKAHLKTTPTYMQSTHPINISPEVKRYLLAGAASKSSDGKHKVFVRNDGQRPIRVQLYKFADINNLNVVPEDDMVVVPPSSSSGIDAFQLVGDTDGVFIGLSVHAGSGKKPTLVGFQNQFQGGGGPQPGNMDYFVHTGQDEPVYLQRMFGAGDGDVIPVTGSA